MTRRICDLFVVVAIASFLSGFCLGYGVEALKVVRLRHEVEVLNMMYDRDVSLSYVQGVKHGREELAELQRGYLELIYSRYPKAAPKHFADWTVRYASKHGVPTALLAGVIMQESSCDHRARSGYGAIGLTQVVWRYWGDYLQELGVAGTCEDLYNPRVSIEAGAAVLRYLLDVTGGDIREALKRYSGGARGYTDKVMRRVRYEKL